MFTATFIIDYLYFLALIEKNLTTCYLKSFFFGTTAIISIVGYNYTFWVSIL